VTIPCGDGDVVGVDGPLQAREPDVEVLLDLRQRRHHDERVERDHEERDGAEDEDPAEARSSLGRAVGHNGNEVPFRGRGFGARW